MRVCLSVCSLVCQSVPLFASLFPCLSVCSPVCQYVPLFVSLLPFLSVPVFVSQFPRLSVGSLVCQYVSLFVSQFPCLSVSPLVCQSVPLCFNKFPCLSICSNVTSVSFARMGLRRCTRFRGSMAMVHTFIQFRNSPRVGNFTKELMWSFDVDCVTLNNSSPSSRTFATLCLFSAIVPS